MDSVSRFSLILLLSVLLFFSISTDSQSVKLSRRNLASTDQTIEEQPTSVKSSVKKSKVSLTDQDPKPVKRKNVLSNDQDELEALKPVKKKKIVSIDLGEKDVPKPAKKKKLDAVEQEIEDDPKPIKKKKTVTIEQEENEDDPKPVKKKKTVTIELEENEDPKPVKKKKSSLTDENEAKSSKKPILDSNFKNQSKPVKLKKTNSTSIPTHNSTKSNSKSQNSTKTVKINKPNSSTPPVKKTKPITSIWLESETDKDDSDLISEFRDLPTQIHEAFLPDLKKISITSKAYIYKANKNMEKNMKPFVGNKYAPKIALAASCIFLILPLCLVTALFYQLNSYLSLQTFLIFIQAYLAIYFFTLALTALATGLEPLRFFYTTSPAYYTWTQAVQTFGYALYLLVQLIHLVVSSSTNDTKLNFQQRMLALVQMVVGLAVGLAVGCHYYNAVFHRAVIGEPPRANWKVHGVYAACFLVICLCAKAERNKKAYDGGEDGKKS